MSAGEIIQYDWTHEETFMTKNELTFASKSKSAISLRGETYDTPTVGFKWKYFATDMGGLCRVTEGNVISVNIESGVVCTDAGEILIRG